MRTRSTARGRSTGGISSTGRTTHGATGSSRTTGTGRTSTTGSTTDAHSITGRITRVVMRRTAGTCTCITPITDDDAGVDLLDDDDDGWLFCWRCGKQIAPID